MKPGAALTVVTGDGQAESWGARHRFVKTEPSVCREEAERQSSDRGPEAGPCEAKTRPPGHP